MKVWTGSWPLSRRDSWQLRYGALRRCCNAPRNEDMGTANVNEEDGRPQLCNRAFIAAGVLARSLLVVPKYFWIV
uniref:Uncharacterized protein n=1 Tax=Hyaloperonospora arabidopsidis (strain Emoy2) TaxID=559515 RepID=M4BQA9_HYAAE